MNDVPDWTTERPGREVPCPRDLSEGRIHIALVPLAPTLPLAEAGRLRIIAITTGQRAPTASEVPTATEAGHPELAVDGVLGFFAPKSMPDKRADPPSQRRAGGQGQHAGRLRGFLDQQRRH